MSQVSSLQKVFLPAEHVFSSWRSFWQNTTDPLLRGSHRSISKEFLQYLSLFLREKGISTKKLTYLHCIREGFEDQFDYTEMKRQKYYLSSENFNLLVDDFVCPN